MEPEAEEVPEFVAGLGGVPAGALDQRFPAVYRELRRLASSLARNSSGATLSPTALVNEAYLKLSASKEFATTSELHFRRIAARVMRQVLCDAARRRLAVKRGGDEAVRVALSDTPEHKSVSLEQIIMVDDLLTRLRELSPRQATVVEYRFFGGLSDREIATELAISKPTVERDWRSARAWLASQINLPM